MKITEVNAIPISVPLTKPTTVASFKVGLESFDNVVINIVTDEGIVGVGESDAIPLYRPETIEGITYAINRYLGPAIVGEDPFNLGSLLERMDATILGNIHAKAGVELALWDIKGKALGVPVYKLLGGAYVKKIPVDYTISIDRPEEMAKMARLRVEQGYSTVVLKIGRDPKVDVQRLKAVREAVGPDIKIRVDANQGYRPDQAIRIIRKLERYDPEAIEQPTKGLDGMAKVAKSVDTPISADESIVTLEDALDIIQREAADILNIKIVKSGGLWKSMKIAAVAEAANVPCILGGLLSLEIARSASRHFAAAIAQVNMGYAGEGPGPASQPLSDNVTKEVINYNDVSRLNGCVEVSEKPGLGVELDENKVRKYIHHLN